MLIHHYLEKAAERFPDKTALVFCKDRLTYRHLDQQADRLANSLVGLGIRRQDRVAILLDNSVESVVALFGILKAGAIFVMLSSGLKAKKLQYILKDSGARALITHSGKTGVVMEAVADAPDLADIIWVDSIPKLPNAGSTPIHHHAWADLLPASSEPSALSSSPYAVHRAPCTDLIIDLDLATIIYTSGSTGEPKGVICAHYNMAAAVESITSYLQNTPEDIVLNVLPLSFDYGLYQVLMTASFGGTLVLEKGFGYLYRLLERIEQENVTGFPIVPTIAAMLLNMNGLGKARLGSLRYITSTGDVLPVPIIAKLRKALPAVKIFSMYGLTECKRVAYLPPAEIDAKPASVGTAIPNTEVLVLREDGEACRPGEIGELAVRGSTVMQGYWNDPELTARVFRRGRYRADALLLSGDLFKTDADGYLYFVKRKDELLKFKGERISPREIEDVLLAMEGVAEAAVVAWSDAGFMKTISAFLALRPEAALDAQALQSHCRRHLEDHLVPKNYFFVEQLPRTGNGKIDRKQLDLEFANRSRIAA
jgi:amino acid adenylation domain-containing protein